MRPPEVSVETQRRGGDPPCTERAEVGQFYFGNLPPKWVNIQSALTVLDEASAAPQRELARAARTAALEMCFRF